MEFKELSPLEFFYRNREVVGFTNPSRSIYTAIRELIENSLDACELYGILPDIYLRMSLEERVSKNEEIFKVVVYDNGSGIPKSQILKVFSTPFYGSKYVIRQSRGLFGLGGSLALIYGQVSTNKPITVKSSTGGDYIYSYTFKVDIKTGNPIVLKRRKEENPDGWHGTLISFYIAGSYSRIAKKVIEYLKQTTIAAPYAQIEFVDPLGRYFPFFRVSHSMPTPPKITKPHPKGIDLETLRIMVRSSESDITLVKFLSENFHRVGERIARKFLTKYGFDPEGRVADLREDDLLHLVNSMKDYNGFLPPDPTVLSPIGRENFIKGIRKEFDPEFLDAVMRPPSSYQGHPFIVEVALAYGGQIPGQPGEIRVYRFANKIPLLYDESSDVVVKVLNNIDWSYYRRPMDRPMALFFHICSTKVPFRSLGKEFIADVPEVEREVSLAVKHLLRRFSHFVSARERERRKERRMEIFRKYLEKISEFSARLIDKKPVDVSPLISQIEQER